MCAYDSQAEGTDFLAWSEWCHFFDDDEWEVLGYAKDVGRWYQVGEGSVSPRPWYDLCLSSLSAFWGNYGCSLYVSPTKLLTDAQTGWIRELVGRLTDSEPRDGPTINSTLDNNPTTFPRGGKRVFVASCLPPITQEFRLTNRILRTITR